MSDSVLNQPVLVRVEGNGSRRNLVLDSPHNRNALSAALVAQLVAALESASGDDSVRVVVITADGPAFCSGADLSERRSGSTAATSAMPELLNQIANCPKPVVVALNGAVRAGGLGLVLAADIVLAAASISLAFSEVRVGVAPAMIAVPALRVVDGRFLSRYMLSGEAFDAAAALAAGVVTAVVPDADLDAAVDELVTALGQGAPGAQAATKALLRQIAHEPFGRALEMAANVSAQQFAGAEGAEGMAAFLEKRPPSWVTK